MVEEKKTATAAFGSHIPVGRYGSNTATCSFDNNYQTRSVCAYDGGNNKKNLRRDTYKRYVLHVCMCVDDWNNKKKENKYKKL